MKRYGKCVNKVAYAYYSDALKAAKMRYFACGVKLSIYECPTCLDFHLTSQYSNLTSYYRKWELFKNPKKTGSTRTRLRNARRNSRKILIQKLPTLFIDVFQYPQPCTFWILILDIIIGTHRGGSDVR